ncbi:MAG: type I restriction enzyme M protein [Akkermansiaceae bacterium]|jgi:type I restriction enzyme M protein
MPDSASIVSKVWNHPPSLSELWRTGNPIPQKFAWSEMSSKSGDELEIHYRHTLENLGKEPGLVGIIFRKAQNKISNPSDLQRVIKMIADED